jgi:hypothetical protein
MIVTIRCGVAGLVCLLGGLFVSSLPAQATQEAMDSAVNSCPDCCPNSCCQDPIWEGRAGFVLLQRNKLPNRTLVRDFTRDGNDAAADGKATILQDANSFAFDFEGGPDVTLIRHGESLDLEFRWFQVHDYLDDRSFRTTNGIQYMYMYPVGGMGTYDVSSRYLSQLSSFEWNLKMPCLLGSDRLTGLVGFRYMNLNESLQFDDLSVYRPVAGAFMAHNHDIQAYNDLYGVQAGLEAVLYGDCDKPLRIEGSTKLGIYGNRAWNRATIATYGAMLPEQFDGADFGSAATNHTAFVGELRCDAVYQITCRLAARIGYQLTWVDGVALASNQMSRLYPYYENDAAAIRHESSVDPRGMAFYHGLVGSLDFRW